MKQRLLTALVGISVAVAWLFTMYTPFFAIIMVFFAVTAEYEMLKVFEVKNIPFKIIAMLLSAAIMLYPDYKAKLNIPLFPVFTAVIIVSLVIMVLDYKNLRFEQVACSLFSSFTVASALSCVVLFRDVYLTFPDVYGKKDGIFFLLFAFFCSWLTDGCALFAGVAFGKHKLAPTISPKKTVEGAIGGVIGNTVLCVVLYFVFHAKFELSDSISLVFVIVSAVILSVLSIFGDLAASTIKRHCGIKDFGNLLPGHGGVMDRFDSCVFVFPALYAILTAVNA